MKPTTPAVLSSVLEAVLAPRSQAQTGDVKVDRMLPLGNRPSNESFHS
jgi:hypothetical protein